MTERDIIVPKVDKNKIQKIGELGSRGDLVRRVRPDGTYIGTETLVITGSSVSGRQGDPGYIKHVFARTLTEEGEISPEDIQLQYDPSLTVVKIGKIDHMDKKNADFFKPLDGERRF